MEESHLCLDVYPRIFQHLPWSSLQRIHRVNRYFQWLAEKEIEIRWNSDLPLGDPNSKFVVITEHIYLETIFCKTGDSTVWIDPRDWSKTWFLNFFDKYFYYSIQQKRYVMSNYLFKQLIRILNHNRNQKAINEFRQTMFFSENFTLESFD